MNVMGTVQPPEREIKKDEEHLYLYKSIESAVNTIAQMSQLQQNLIQKHDNKKEIIPNCGRIILFTPTNHRNLDNIQECLNNSIINCNKKINENEL